MKTQATCAEQVVLWTSRMTILPVLTPAENASAEYYFNRVVFQYSFTSHPDTDAALLRAAVGYVPLQVSLSTGSLTHDGYIGPGMMLGSNHFVHPVCGHNGGVP